jgi:TetR/AcrR family transcriptional regulator, transcriptional repressor of bet genes
VSVGRVQHYFPTKFEVLEAAFQQVNDWGGELVRRRLDAAGDFGPRAVLRAVATALLPVDDQARGALQVGVAFLARALVHDETAARLRTGYGEMQELFVVLLNRARDAGDAVPDLDPEQEAALLLALLDGLGTLTLVGHHSVDTALSAIDAHLDRVFLPSC